MPYRMSSGRHSRRFVVALTLFYLFLALAGFVGCWFAGLMELPLWAEHVVRWSGLLMWVSSTVAMWAQIYQRWLVELDVLWVIGLSTSGFLVVMLLGIPIRPHWILVSLVFTAVISILVARSAVLADEVVTATESKERKRGER